MSCMVDYRIPVMPGRSASGFYRPGRHCLHQAPSAVWHSASRMKGELHPTTCEPLSRRAIFHMDDRVERISLFSGGERGGEEGVHVFGRASGVGAKAKQHQHQHMKTNCPSHLRPEITYIYIYISYTNSKLVAPKNVCPIQKGSTPELFTGHDPTRGAGRKVFEVPRDGLD